MDTSDDMEIVKEGALYLQEDVKRASIFSSKKFTWSLRQAKLLRRRNGRSYLVLYAINKITKKAEPCVTIPLKKETDVKPMPQEDKRGAYFFYIVNETCYTFYAEIETQRTEWLTKLMASRERRVKESSPVRAEEKPVVGGVDRDDKERDSRDLPRDRDRGTRKHTTLSPQEISRLRRQYKEEIHTRARRRDRDMSRGDVETENDRDGLDASPSRSPPPSRTTAGQDNVENKAVSLADLALVSNPPQQDQAVKKLKIDTTPTSASVSFYAAAPTIGITYEDVVSQPVPVTSLPSSSGVASSEPSLPHASPVSLSASADLVDDSQQLLSSSAQTAAALPVTIPPPPISTAEPPCSQSPARVQSLIQVFEKLPLPSKVGASRAIASDMNGAYYVHDVQSAQQPHQEQGNYFLVPSHPQPAVPGHSPFSGDYAGYFQGDFTPSAPLRTCEHRYDRRLPPPQSAPPIRASMSPPHEQLPCRGHSSYSAQFSGSLCTYSEASYPQQQYYGATASVRSSTGSMIVPASAVPAGPKTLIGGGGSGPSPVPRAERPGRPHRISEDPKAHTHVHQHSSFAAGLSSRLNMFKPTQRVEQNQQQQQSRRVGAESVSSIATPLDTAVASFVSGSSKDESDSLVTHGGCNYSILGSTSAPSTPAKKISTVDASTLTTIEPDASGLQRGPNSSCVDGVSGSEASILMRELQALATMNDQLNSVIEKMDAEREAELSRAKAADDEVLRLHEELAIVNQQKSALENELLQAQDKLRDALEFRFDRAERSDQSEMKIRLLMLRIQELEGALGAMQARNSDSPLNSQNRRSSPEAASVNQYVDKSAHPMGPGWERELLEELTTAYAKEGEKDELIKSLNEKLRTLNAEHDMAVERIKVGYESELARVRASDQESALYDIQKITDLLQIAENSLEDQLSRTGDLVAQIAALTAERDILNDQLGKARSAAIERDEECAKVVSELRAKFKALSLENNQLISARAALQTRYDSAKERLLKMDEQLLDAQRTAAAAVADQTRCRHELQDARDASGRSLKELQARLRTQESENRLESQRYVRLAQELEHRIADCEAVKTDLRIRLAAAEAEAQRHQLATNACKVELVALQDNFEVLQAEVSRRERQAEARVSGLEAEVAMHLQVAEELRCGADAADALRISQEEAQTLQSLDLSNRLKDAEIKIRYLEEEAAAASTETALAKSVLLEHETANEAAKDLLLARVRNLSATLAASETHHNIAAEAAALEEQRLRTEVSGLLRDLDKAKSDLEDSKKAAEESSAARAKLEAERGVNQLSIESLRSENSRLQKELDEAVKTLDDAIARRASDNEAKTAEIDALRDSLNKELEAALEDSKENASRVVSLQKQAAIMNQTLEEFRMGQQEHEEFRKRYKEQMNALSHSRDSLRLSLSLLHRDTTCASEPPRVTETDEFDPDVGDACNGVALVDTEIHEIVLRLSSTLPEISSILSATLGLLRSEKYKIEKSTTGVDSDIYDVYAEDIELVDVVKELVESVSFMQTSSDVGMCMRQIATMIRASVLNILEECKSTALRLKIASQEAAEVRDKLETESAKVISLIKELEEAKSAHRKEITLLHEDINQYSMESEEMQDHFAKEMGDLRAELARVKNEQARELAMISANASAAEADLREALASEQLRDDESRTQIRNDVEAKVLGVFHAQVAAVLNSLSGRDEPTGHNVLQPDEHGISKSMLSELLNLKSSILDAATVTADSLREQLSYVTQEKAGLQKSALIFACEIDSLKEMIVKQQEAYKILQGSRDELCEGLEEELAELREQIERAAHDAAAEKRKRIEAEHALRKLRAAAVATASSSSALPRGATFIPVDGLRGMSPARSRSTTPGSHRRPLFVLRAMQQEESATASHAPMLRDAEEYVSGETNLTTEGSQVSTLVYDEQRRRSTRASLKYSLSDSCGDNTSTGEDSSSSAQPPVSSRSSAAKRTGPQQRQPIRDDNASPSHLSNIMVSYWGDAFESSAERNSLP